MNKKNLEGFKKFIDYLADGGIFEDKHWCPQHKLLFLDPKDLSIIKLENLDEELKAFLQNANIEFSPDIDLTKPHTAEINSEKEKIQGSSDLLATYYDQSTAKKVYGLYREDFEIFNYDGRLEAL